jgi:hypothetical protein
MADVEARQESGKPADRPVVVSAKPVNRSTRAPRFRILRLLITLVTTAVAAAFGWAMWKTYMQTPWTRDGVVRTYVVTIAPEVAGRIVEFPVVDNQFVHKGDVLLVIRPTTRSRSSSPRRPWNGCRRRRRMRRSKRSVGAS